MGRVGIGMIAVVMFAGVAASAQESSPLIVGATGDEKEQIKAALQKVPECWRKCAAGYGEMPIHVIEGEQAGQAYYNPAQDLILIDRLSLSSKKANKALEDTRAVFCTDKNDTNFGTGTEPLVRTLAHELAHKRHGGCGLKSKVDVNGFIKKRFFEKRTALRNDPEYQKTLDARTALWSEARDLYYKKHPNAQPAETTAEKMRRLRSAMTPEMLAKSCELQKKISELYRKHGLPARFPGDTHAAEPDTSDLEEDGAEYFAMLIETALFDGAEFCRATDSDEVRFIRENYGECLAKFGRPMPPCWDSGAPSNGMPASRPTGEFLRP